MKPRALWKLRNRGNHGHRYAVEWRCDQCTNVVSEYLPEQHWLNLAKKFPHVVRQGLAPTTKHVRLQRIAARAARRRGDIPVGPLRNVATIQ